MAALIHAGWRKAQARVSAHFAVKTTMLVALLVLGGVGSAPWFAVTVMPVRAAVTQQPMPQPASTRSPLFATDAFDERSMHVALTRGSMSSTSVFGYLLAGAGRAWTDDPTTPCCAPK